LLSLLCLGDTKKVAELTGLTEKQIREYRDEPWWTEIQKKIMVEQNDGLLSKINDTIEQALAMLEDRILNGDAKHIDERIGKDGNLISEEKTVRVQLKRATYLNLHALTHQRNLMRVINRDTFPTTTEKRLDDLAEHFKKFTQSREIEGTFTEVKS